MAKLLGNNLTQAARGAAWPADALVFYTDAVTPSTFDPSWVTLAGQTLTVDYGDGTATDTSNVGVSHLYAAAGRKEVHITCADWSKVTLFDINTDVCVLALPSLAACTSLGYCYIRQNQFSGVLPSFAACTNLVEWVGSANLFSGAPPSFAACTLLTYFSASTNLFAGTLPSFATCTALVQFYFSGNQLSSYTAGSFATQRNMTVCNLQTNQFPQAAIDNILLDCVTSLAIPGRVVCNLNLGGVGNAAPSAAGYANRDTLVANGWTVSVN